jgi:hypothetical protein
MHDIRKLVYELLRRFDGEMLDIPIALESVEWTSPASCAPVIRDVEGI